VVKILQGSVVTQTTLGDLTIYPQFANFLQCICAKNYENWLAVDKVIAKIIRLTFFWPTLYIIGQLIFHCEISVQSPVVCDISHYSVRWQMANYGMCTMYIYIKWIGLCDYNPTLEANTKWIGWRVAEIWPFEIFQNGWSTFVNIYTPYTDVILLFRYERCARGVKTTLVIHRLLWRSTGGMWL